MKKGLLQEKFQRTMKDDRKQDHQWTSFESQRKTSSPVTKNNRMPPGMNVGNQKHSEQHKQPESLAGATDESNSVNASMLKKGYQRQDMKPEDELYNDEHVELFYGTAEVDGDVGFCERNNYLDRT